MTAELACLLANCITPDLEADDRACAGRRLPEHGCSNVKHIAYAPRSGASSEADAR